MAIKNSEFVINDITLFIPPKNIRVARQSFNNRWHTLRTQSSMKSKSGFATLDVNLTVEFTDDIVSREAVGVFTNGYKKLLDLVSQFRVTPFCYVENQYLRDAVLSGGTTKNMALALKQIEIVKTNEDSNVITVFFNFSWFNYSPYTQDFLFRRHIYSVGSPVQTPSESRAWRLLYEAEQKRNNYQPISALTGDLKLTFNEYGSITVKRYAQLEEEVRALAELQEKLAEYAGHNEVPGGTESMVSLLRDSLGGSGTRAKALYEQTFGRATTMGSENPQNTLQRMISVIDETLAPTSTRYQFITADYDWQAVILRGGKVVTFKHSPSLKLDADTVSKYDKEDTILLTRKRELDFRSNRLIVQGISISFESILATIPLCGHPYPTYQHIGSTDAKVSFSIITDDQNSLAMLSDFYSTVENQAHKYRNVPAGHRNIQVQNDLVNMCGLHHFIQEEYISENVEGEPGTFVASLVLYDDPLNPDTQEQITAGQSFTSSSLLRNKVIEILEKSISFDAELFNVNAETYLKAGSFGNAQFRKLGALLSTGIKGNIRLFNQLLEVVAGDRDSISIDEATDRYAKSYYKYNGKTKRNEAFSSLASVYAIKLGDLFGGLSSIINNLKRRVLEGNSKNIIGDIFALTNDYVPGIEFIQDDLSKAYEAVKDTFDVSDKNKTLNPIKKHSVDKYISDKQENEQVIAALNIKNERAALSDNDVEVAGFDAVTSGSDQILSSYRYTNQARLEDIVNTYFSDWLKFVVPFVDEILNNADLLSLPEFKDVKELIKSNRGALGSSTTAYQDFPMTQVLSVLEASPDEADTSAAKKLYYLWQKANLGIRNIGPSALINPDFYFYNPQNDLVDRLIPYEVMTKAKDNIIAGRKSMYEAEKTFFSGAYAASIAGKGKTESLFDLASDFLKNKSTSNNDEPEEIKSTRQKFSNHLKNYKIAPPLLIGSVGPSNYEASKNNESVVLKEIGYSSSKNSGDKNKTSDSQNVFFNYRGQETLKPSPRSNEVKHRFDTVNSIDFLPETDYQDPPKIEPNKTPDFQYPTASYARRITCPFGPRLDPVKKQKGQEVEQFHRGVDLAHDDRKQSLGTPIYAAADGEIIYVIIDEENAIKSGGKLIIKHGNGYKTVYQHMVYDPDYLGFFSDVLNRGAQKGLSTKNQKRALTVRRGDQIGLMGNTGYSTGAHLHFEILKDGQPIDPIALLNGGEIVSRDIFVGMDPRNESLLTKSVEQFEKDLKNGQGYGMNRAYPAYKLYFIESDLGERRRFAYDDFFNYSSVQEIEIIKTRKMPADLAVVRLTNISGVLNNRKFYDAKDPFATFAQSGAVAKENLDRSKTNTLEENPIKSLMLQPGTQIQIRLGYNNNPDELTDTFDGVIVDVAFSDTTDLVEITCQTFAIELIQTIQGSVKSFGGWFSGDGRTFKILNEVMSFPEIAHFGRWEGGEIGKNKNFSLLHGRLTFIPTPQEDNLFPPQGSGELGLIDRLAGALSSTPKYVMYNTTVWDVIQEMTMRHPSYIARAVSYEGKYGPRMTMFFGLPDQLYFARDATNEENDVIAKIRQIVKEGTSGTSEETRENLTANKDISADKLDEGLAEVSKKRDLKEQEAWVKKISKLYAQNRGFIRPFRSYHVLTSTQHIISNSIALSSNKVFNTATIQYSDGGAKLDKETAQLGFDDLKTFTVVASDALPDEEKREIFGNFPNCYDADMAKIYGLSVLFNSLKEAYGGSVVSIGNPNINPYDICYIFDEYNDCYGPIEVEQVVHKFSFQYGFVTEITPDLVVHVAQEATLSTSDAMGLMAEHALRKIGLESLPSITETLTSSPFSPLTPFMGALNGSFSPIAKMFFNKTENALGQNGSSNPLSMLGIFVFRKLITRTQLAFPFRFSPLVLAGKPMVGGLPNKFTSGGMVQDGEKWFADAPRGVSLLLEDGYDRVNPNNWLNQGHYPSSWQELVFGSGGDK